MIAILQATQAGKALAAGLLVIALLAAPGPVGAEAADLEDLLFDLQLIPLLGQDPPPFTLESLDGKKVSLADYRGKPVFLYFWATW